MSASTSRGAGCVSRANGCPAVGGIAAAVIVGVVVARPSALQSHEQRKSAEENKRTTATPVKSGGYAGCLPALRVHEHDDSPPNTLQRANHTASPFSNYSNGPVGAGRPLGFSAVQLQQ